MIIMINPIRAKHQIGKSLEPVWYLDVITNATAFKCALQWILTRLQ